MLVDMMTGDPITKIPYAADFRHYMSRMTAAEIEAINDALNGMIEGTEIKTAGWMPGKEWKGTPFFPIYERAARHNPNIAAKCFGLMVWVVFMNRPETWTSGRFEKDGEPIGSRTYFLDRRSGPA